MVSFMTHVIPGRAARQRGAQAALAVGRVRIEGGVGVARRGVGVCVGGVGLLVRVVGVGGLGVGVVAVWLLLLVVVGRRRVLRGGVGRGGVAAGILWGSAAVAALGGGVGGGLEGGDVQVSGVALGIAGVVGAVLAALLAVLEAAVLGRAVRVDALRRGEVWFLWCVALLAVVWALRGVALLLVVVLARWLLVSLAAGSRGAVVGGVLVVWV